MERLDDSDSGLAYIPPGAWFIGGSLEEYNFTTHGTRQAGAQMRFAFAGTGVDVYGTIYDSLSALPASNRFILDGGDPVSWTAKTSPTAVYNTNMFRAHGLESGTHTLVMEVLMRDSETWIDYLEVSRATSSSVSTLTSASTPGPDTVTKTITVFTEDNRPTFSTVPTVSSKNTISPGAVAGISVGGTLALVLALLFLLFCLRRRRVASNADPFTIPRSSGRVTGIRPFLLWDHGPSSLGTIMGNPTASDKQHLPLNESPPSYVP
ncbi:hypothetical protein PQX77_011666 [Marasmius sp. AFHP31]|nr:hypothetical protein PQX77_011666 [Marasmius sp. AFHP31]